MERAKGIEPSSPFTVLEASKINVFAFLERIYLHFLFSPLFSPHGKHCEKKKVPVLDGLLHES